MNSWKHAKYDTIEYRDLLMIDRLNAFVIHTYLAIFTCIFRFVSCFTNRRYSLESRYDADEISKCLAYHT